MEELRSSLAVYAYNILGSYEDAKDVVQDVFLKFAQLDPGHIKEKKSYLIRMVVNLAIDQKRKQKKRLADYPGNWLPEPVATDDPQTPVHRKQILSYSLMVLLEKLDSKQRAVFILKEAFDYDHGEIAEVLGITIENSRKILSRAKQELQGTGAARPEKKQQEAVNIYLSAIQSGDMKKLEQLLNDDITVTSDGGGKAPAFRNIIRGIQSVSALLSGLYKKIYHKGQVEIAWVNYQPAIFYSFENKIITCQIFSLKDGKIDRIFFMRNPDKLNHLQKISVKGVTFS